MLPGILGRAADSTLLRDMLDVSMNRTKTIADRVSRASLASTDGFSLTPSGEAPVDGDDTIDIEQEMVSLADEQLHFEATAKLLEKAYAQLRLAIKDR